MATQKYVDYGIAKLLLSKGFPLKDCGDICYNHNLEDTTRKISHQQAIDFFRETHKLVLDVFQEHDTENNIYTGNWLVDISKLGCYEEPHVIEITDTYSNYYNALNRAIEEALKII